MSSYKAAVATKRSYGFRGLARYMTLYLRLTLLSRLEHWPKLGLVLLHWLSAETGLTFLSKTGLNRLRKLATWLHETSIKLTGNSGGGGSEAESGHSRIGYDMIANLENLLISLSLSLAREKDDDTQAAHAE